LHERQAAHGLDRREPRCTVPKPPGQDDPDHTRSVGQRRRPHHRIDGWPRQILAGADAEARLAIGQEHVAVGRGHIDAALPDRAVIPCGHDRQAASPEESLYKAAPMVSGHVDGHEQAGVQIRRQSAEQQAQRPERAGRAADCYDVPLQGRLS